MSEELTGRAEVISASEPHRAVMLVMAARLDATVTRNADTMYRCVEDFLVDLRVVGSVHSLSRRSACGVWSRANAYVAGGDVRFPYGGNGVPSAFSGS